LSSKPAIWTSFHVEKLDIDDTESIAALGDRLSGRRLDMLFINAGTTTREQDIPVGLVTTSEFNRVMLTNALGPMRVIEALEGYVPADGMIGAMSSGQGSIANNDRGLREVYRASKAALNMSMRSFAASQRGGERALLLLALGWIRTDLGGSDAPIR
jgi:NAD(P)-dependent dehydrogenase (short-subunit alcohol dehydrogenase family)